MKRIKFIHLTAAIAMVLSACNQPTPSPTPQPAPKPSATAASVATPAPQPSPTPRPATNPIVVDVTPARGEALPLDKPLTVRFDQPMDKASVEQALQVRGGASELRGQIAWQGDSILTFTPKDGWKRNETYSAQVGETAKSAKGLTLNKPQSFRFSAIGSFVAAQTIPANGADDVTADATITVMFNRPVVALVGVAQQASLPQPLTFSPEVAGKGEWVNTSVYVFKPAAPLAAGTTYKAKISATLTDTLGATLDEATEWAFTVSSPSVKFITPGANSRDADLRQPISVTFSQKMDHASAEAAFKLTPAVRGVFRWGDETGAEHEQTGGAPRGNAPSAAPATTLGEVMAFVPQENYARATNYKIEISAGAKAAAGDGRIKEARASAFRSIENVAVAGTTPANGSTTHEADSRQVMIQFAAPVLPETVLGNLSFEPAISLTNVYTYWDNTGKQFVINNLSLQPSTKYRLSIGADIADKYGQKTGKTSVVEFTTAPARPVVILGSGAEIGTLNASKPARAQVGFRNITRLDFQLSRLSVDEFYKLTGDGAYQARQNYKPDPASVIRAWGVDVSAKQNELANAVIALTENNAQLPTGIYMLTMEAPEMKTIKNAFFETTKQILVVTNHQVTMKQALSKVLVWVTDLTSGAPAPNLPIALVDKNRKNIATVGTDASGMGLAQNVSFAQPYDPFYAIIGQPGAANFGIGFSQWTNDIEPYQFGIPTDYASDAQPRVKTYLYTDRPIYRPGQTVNFKGFIRADNDARYSLMAGLTQAQVNAASDRSITVYSQTVAVNGNGTFNGSFTLADGAATGYYSLQVLFPAACEPREKAAQTGGKPCHQESISFQVAAYRKPEFEVSLTPAKLDVTSGETAQVNLQASAYFGGNIGGAKTDWTMTATPYIFDRYTDQTDPFYGRYSFIDADAAYPVWPPEPKDTGVFAQGAGQTDANGKYALTAPIDLGKSETSLELNFSAGVTDLNDQTIGADAKVIAHKGAFYFGIAPEEYVMSAGEPITAHVLATDWAGKPMAGTAGSVALYRREWKLSYGMNPFGENGPIWQPMDTRLAESPITTDKDGRATSNFAITEGGEYRLVVSQGAVKAASSIWATQPGAYLRWRTGDNNRISLRPDKTEYKVGEVAKVLAPSPFSGTVYALMTIERGDILQQKVIQLKGNNETLEIPITQEFAPNAFVSLVLAKGAGAAGLAEFRLGYAQINVDPSAFELKLEITPDKPAYAPRDTVTFDIRATTASGAPAQAELSIALIDKAVLALAEPNSAKPMQAFYSARGLLVRTSNNLSVRADVADLAKAASERGGMGGGGGGATDPGVRQNFQDAAFWSAITQTGADGRAQVKVTLPDNLTTWALDARAITPDTKVGSATKEVSATKPLLVRPVAPRFLVVGDEVTLGAVVNNNTANAAQAQVTLAASGLVLKSAALQTVSVPAHGSARVDWQVVVPDGNLADVTFSAVAGDLKDSAKPELGAKGIPVLRYLSPETVATAGEVSAPGKKLELIALPPRLEAGKSQLEVNVNTSLAQVITDSAYFLRQNQEYEDNLQIAARILVNVSQNSATETIAADAAKLLNRQRDDTGWGWMEESDKSSPIISAYALWALNKAWQVAGQQLGSKDQLTRANDYLRAQLGDSNTFLNRVAADESAFYAFVLSESGTQITAYVDQLHKNKDKLGSFGKALLAMTLANANKADPKIAGLLADVNSAVNQSATGATWSSANGGLQRWAFTAFYCTDTRATAMIVYALARLDAKNATLPNAVRWLVAARSGRAWEGAQDALWGILALDSYADATGDRNAAYDWRVSLNDTKLMDGRASPNQPAPNSAVLTATQLLSGTNALGFERGDGEGRLYYTAQLKAFLPAAEATALDRGISIRRVYELADCEPQPDKPCQPLTSVPLGKNVRVRLSVIAPTGLYFVKISDPFAAGMEPVDVKLRNRPMPLFKFAPQWFGNTQLYDDRAEIYADYLPAGTHEFAYVVRASLAGSFSVMPAHVSQAYFPETFGRSDGMRFEVSK